MKLGIKMSFTYINLVVKKHLTATVSSVWGTFEQVSPFLHFEVVGLVGASNPGPHHLLLLDQVAWQPQLIGNNRLGPVAHY